MKLMELVGVKKFFDLYLEDLILNFIKHGNYKKLGNGFFAYVFKNPNKNEVIKFWADDSLYEKYISYVAKNQSNLMFPKLYSKIKTISTFHKRAPGFPEKIKYIRMEVLEEVNAQDAKTIETINWEYTITLRRKNLESITYQNYVSDIDERFKNIIRSLDYLLDDIGVNINDLDINSTNIMRRNNQLVITDPFAGEDSINIMHDIKSLQQDMEDGTIPSIKGRNLK